MDLEFYTEAQDLSYLLDYMKNSSSLGKRYEKLNQYICELSKNLLRVY